MSADAAKHTGSDTKGRRLVFFGNERLATGVSTTAPTLHRLLTAGYDIVAVVSHNNTSGDGKSRRTRDLEIAAVAAEHNIPVLLPERPAEILDELRNFHAEAGILVAYGRIIPQSVIDIFPRGIINIHPSLLPLHRGPIPVESVILQGAPETGVSVMQLAAAMDAGPVYGQDRLAISGRETKQELADKLLEAGGELLVRLLPGILDGSITPLPQDDAAATYDTLIQKADGLLDFHKPATELAREVRAYAVWPGSRTKLGDMDIIVTSAHTQSTNNTNDTLVKSPGTLWRADQEFGFYTGGDSLLVIDRLKPSGRQEMTAAAFLNGYKI